MLMNLSQISAFTSAHTLPAKARSYLTSICGACTTREFYTAVQEVVDAILNKEMMAWVLDDLVNELRRVSYEARCNNGIEMDAIANTLEGALDFLAKSEVEHEWSLYKWSDLTESLILIGTYESKSDAKWMVDSKVSEYESWAIGVIGEQVLDKTMRYKKDDESCVSSLESVYVISRGEPKHFNADGLREKRIV